MSKKRKNNNGNDGSRTKQHNGISNKNNNNKKIKKNKQELEEEEEKQQQQHGRHRRRGRRSQQQQIPVTILSGFLGSGKTTLLKHILTSKEHQLKIAVIVNDMAELNIDGAAIRRTTAEKEKVVSTLENGCICCTLRGDLIREIQRIRELEVFDYVVIESTGIAEPQQVAESFCVDPMTETIAKNDDRMLWNTARLDTCVTVVDAVEFPHYISSLKRFQDMFHDGLDDIDEEKEGEKSVSELMVEQVEFANVVLLNKIDLVSDKQQQIARKLITTLNPKARVATASYGKMDLRYILNTGLFNMEEASESPGWLVSLKDGVTASEGEADEYGVSSFVYRARKPFHPFRLHAFLKQFFCFAEEWARSSMSTTTTTTTTSTSHSTNKQADDDHDQDQQKKKNNKEEKEKEKIRRRKLMRIELEEKYGLILRSKGTCWIAGRDDHEFEWHQTGRIIQLNPTAAWYCKTPKEELKFTTEQELEAEEDKNDGDETEKEDSKNRAKEAKFYYTDDESGNRIKYKYGDRRQEIVFIGTNLQQRNVQMSLNECLLTEDEIQYHGIDLPLGTYPDPLLPMLVSCDSSRSLFLIARVGQNQHLDVIPGFVLTFQNLALNVNYDTTTEGNRTIKAVKVWLDKSDDVARGVLLATLRPDSYEQHSMAVTLLPFDKGNGEEAEHRRIRVEVIYQQKKNKSNNNKKTTTATTTMTMAMEQHMEDCEVHIMGRIEPLPYKEDDEDDSESNMNDQQCSDQFCS